LCSSLFSFFFSSRRRHTRWPRDWSSDVCSSDLKQTQINDAIAKLKTRTGIDPRSFDRIVVGFRYTYPSPSVTKVENVTIAQGRRSEERRVGKEGRSRVAA